MRLTDRSAHPIKTYLLSSLRVLMHVNYINLTVYSVAKTDHYKFGRASSSMKRSGIEEIGVL